MPINHHRATGALVLDKVTPVITALFGAFNLDADLPGKGQAYFAQRSESTDPQWMDIHEALSTLARNLGVSSPDDDISIESMIEGLARHFGTDQDAALANLIDQHVFDGPAELEALFLIATRLDDGHGLVAIEVEGCWQSSVPRLFQFGGYGRFISREVEVSTASRDARSIGRDLRDALVADHLDRAAVMIANPALKLLAGVTDECVRRNLYRAVALHLIDASFTANAG